MDMPMSPSPSSMEMMRMRNSFYWGSDAVFMFPNWPGSGGMYVLSLIMLFVVSIGKEYMSIHHPHHMDKNASWVVAALSHTVHLTVGYLLMLAVMSYNLGVFIVVLAGSALGFYIFHKRLPTEGEESK
ncbi:hypothetical protein KI387_033574, partial [Taxus chinensis]